MSHVVSQCPECHKDLRLPETRFESLEIGHEVLCGNCGLTSLVDAKEVHGKRRRLHLRPKQSAVRPLKDPGTDLPAKGEADLLSMRNAAEGFARFLAQRATPMTVAIEGEGGIGKSSFLQMLEEAFGHRQEIEARGGIAHYVSLYANTPELAASSHLFYVIEFPVGLFRHSGKVGRLFVLFLLEALRTIVEGKKFSPTGLRKRLSERAIEIGDYADEPQEGAGAMILDLLEETHYLCFLKEELRGLSRKVLRRFPNKRVRIVVILDELDTLSPGTASELVETLKSYCEQEGFIFLLACESSRLSGGSGEEKERRLFASKMFQIVYQLPTPPAERVLDIARNFPVVKHLIPQYERAFFDILKVFPHLSRNLRNLKRLLNTYELTLTVAGLDRNTPKEGKRKMQLILLLLTALYQFDERCYRHLEASVRRFGDAKKPNEILRVLETFARKEEVVLQLEAGERSSQQLIDSIHMSRMENTSNPRYSVISGVIQIIVTQGWSEKDLLRGFEYVCR
ncbi:MAG: hypothetical protein D6795_18430 [Deltaproteobacteria bacterium]|nr:MAG: hypothetical protein D6795_18430 [Deltaproteobacteria bacterium]